MSSSQSPRIVGGHVGLDLVNTVAPRTPSGQEHEDYLATPAHLLQWARRVRVLSEAEADAVAAAWAVAPGADEQALRGVWEIREATYRVLTAALSGGAHRVDTLDALGQLFLRWNAAVARGALAPAGMRRVRLRHVCQKPVPAPIRKVMHDGFVRSRTFRI